MKPARDGIRHPYRSSRLGQGGILRQQDGAPLNGVSAQQDTGGAAQSLMAENQELRRKLWKARRRPSRMVGTALSAMGFAALLLAVFYESSILAFIGLGLTFWGVLLLFVRPTNYVKGQLLDSATETSYASLDRLLEHLGYEGEPVYLPPKELKALKSGIMYITVQRGENIPKDPLPEDVSGEQLFTTSPPGIYLVAPGLGLANLMEEEMGQDFSKSNIDYLQRNLPSVIIEGLELAEGMEFEVEGGTVMVKIVNSLYEKFYGSLNERLKRFGCPLISAIALALTRAAGKPVIVEHIGSEPENKTRYARYVILGGTNA